MVDNPWICGGSQGVFAYGVSEIALSKNVVFVKTDFQPIHDRSPISAASHLH